jgi:uncharacterized protein (TIGR02271 family)
MSTTITAMFDSRAEAEAAKDRLRTARVDANDVHIHDQSSAGYSNSNYSTHQELGFWDSVKNAFLPDKDRHAYEEGVRRGGAVLTADVDEDCVDEAVRVLESANTIDIEERSSQWRSSGWDYPAAGAGTAGTAATLGGGGYSSADRDLDTDRSALATEQEEVIPVVEEQLVVGKRDVNRGGVRVRSYVTETPVHEQVRLRNERVNVERRTVDQPLSGTDADAFQERTINVTATGEEAVVGKNARVVEEVVVSKSAEEHVEEIDDTVRRTEVDIDDETDVERTGVNRGTTDKRI